MKTALFVPEGGRKHVAEAVRHTMSLMTKDFVCGGCISCEQSPSGDDLVECRMEITDLGIVLCNGIGYVPGGGRPLAEVAAWECSRLLQLGLEAQDVLMGARKLLARVAVLTESGWSSIFVARFLSDGTLELCYSGDTIGVVVGKGTVKPLSETHVNRGVVPANIDEFDRDSHHLCRVNLGAGECLCAMSGNAWKNMPLSSIAHTCMDHTGDVSDAAACLVDVAECYGSPSDVAVALIERWAENFSGA